MNDRLQVAIFVLANVQMPRWLLMWTLAVVLFAVAKWVTLWEARRHGRRIRSGRTASYVLLWVGMDPRAFWARKEPAEPVMAAAAPGVVKLVVGALLLWGVAPIFHGVVAGWIGMVGIVLVLHFGLFHLLAVFWAQHGSAVQPIMNRPLCARTLAEFWGDRWNRAFNELMHRFVFKPAARRVGLPAATLTVFLVSGLIHDAVISGPAGHGYGGPTIYFVVQALGLLAQRTSVAKRLGWNSGWKARLFTAVFLLTPLPMLFHAPFITRVILPFMEVIGARKIGGLI